MKKILYFSLAFFSYLYIANAQVQHHSTKDFLPNNTKHPKQFRTKSLVWNFDTVVTYDTTGLLQRRTRIHDIHGNTLTELSEQWQNNAWVNDYRYNYTYDANGNQLTTLREIWQNNAWVNSQIITETYDASGNELTSSIKNWQYFEWVNYRRYTKTYDANGNQLTTLVEQGQSNSWVNNNRYTYTYDANGNMLTLLNEQWQSNAWVNYSKSTFTCDANGNILTELYKHWQSNAWMNSDRFTNTYDVNGNKLTDLWETYHNFAWVNEWRKTDTYDANGNMLAELCEQWLGNAWVNSERDSYTFDVNGNSVTGKLEMWMNNNWHNSLGSLQLYPTWVYSIPSIHRYEASWVSFTGGNFFDLSLINGAVNDTLFVPSYPTTLDAGGGWQSYIWSNGSSTQTTLVSIDGWYSVTVTHNGKSIFSDSIYVALSTSIRKIQLNSKITLYPNPNEGLFTVDFGERLAIHKIEIYNVLGKLIYVTNESSQLDTYKINISSSPTGIYFLKIYYGNNLYLEKVYKK